MDAHDASLARDREQLRTEGFVLVRDLVPAGHRRAAIDAVCAFHGIAYGDRSTWYRMPPASWDMVPVHHAQAIWDNRCLPSIHAAFAEVLGTERLWVSMDRSGFKPPASGHPDFDRSSTIHWDANLPERVCDPVPWLQGMIFLTDTADGAGPFECVPSLFRGAAAWNEAHPGAAPEPEVLDRDIVRVAGRAGDLVIWNALLPHRGGRNDGRTPRVTQYVTMHEAGTRDETAASRVALWRDKRVPDSWRTWPATVIDPESGPPACLDALGRKLVGLDPW